MSDKVVAFYDAYLLKHPKHQKTARYTAKRLAGLLSEWFEGEDREGRFPSTSAHGSCPSNSKLAAIPVFVVPFSINQIHVTGYKTMALYVNKIKIRQTQSKIAITRVAQLCIHVLEEGEHKIIVIHNQKINK